MVTIECDHQPAPVRGVHLGPLGWSIIKGNPTIVQVKRDTRCTWSLLVYMYVYMCVCVCMRHAIIYRIVSSAGLRQDCSLGRDRCTIFVPFITRLGCLSWTITPKWKLQLLIHGKLEKWRGSWLIVIIRVQVYVRWWLEKCIKVLSFVGHVSNLVENWREFVVAYRPLEID